MCETGHDPPYWDWGRPGSGHGEMSGYEGGIGFAPSTWRWWGRMVGAYPRYQHAYLAPPWLQARAAAWGLEHIGKWGCVFRLT